jgi:hypothetical protein
MECGIQLNTGNQVQGLRQKHRNECQQKHQEAAHHGQHNWHKRDDGFNAILRFCMVRVLRLGHDE